MSEERERILKMLEDGRITADQAARLIEALGSGRPERHRFFHEMPRPPRPPRPERHMRVRLAELDRIPDIVAGAVSSAMREGMAGQGELDQDFPGKTSLFLKSVSGDVEVRSSDRDGIRLVNSGGFVKVREREDKVMARTISGDFKVEVPPKCRMELVSVSGDVTVSGGRGSFQLKSVSGDVALHGFEGTVAAEVVSGDIELDGARGVLTVESKSGDICCRPAGPVEGSLTNKSGDIRLRLAPGADLVLDMECEEDGEIMVGLGMTFETLEEGDNRLKIKLGEGSRELKLRTRDGEIKVEDEEEQ